MRPWTSVPRQRGRRFVITGANQGVGLAVAQILGSRGASVVLACRDLTRARAAARLVPGYDDGRVDVRSLDLADAASVRAFADTFVDEPPIDVLINNAGILGAPYIPGTAGVDPHFQTNHLGHFALTNLLLPVIHDRVVVTGSRQHRSGVLELDDLAWERRRYTPFAAYGQSKLANLLFLSELDRRLQAAGSRVRAVGAHPGSTATALLQLDGRPLLTAAAVWSQRLWSMPACRGALCTVHAATMDVPGNSYIGPHGRLELLGWPTQARRSAAAQDASLAQRLWQASEQLTGVRFPAATGRA